MASNPPTADIEAFLEQHLEAITDADPKTLTPYILALIHKPKKYCTEQLRDFLHEETEPFVDKLFEFLAKQPNFRKGKEDRDRKRERSDKEVKRRRHEEEEHDAKRAKRERHGDGSRHSEKSSKTRPKMEELLVLNRAPPPSYQESNGRQLRTTTADTRKRTSSRNHMKGEEEDFTVPLNPLENSVNSILLSTDVRAPSGNQFVVDSNPPPQIVLSSTRGGPAGPTHLFQPGPQGPHLQGFHPNLMQLQHTPQQPLPMQFPPAQQFAGFGPQGSLPDPRLLVPHGPQHPINHHPQQLPSPMALQTMPMGPVMQSPMLSVPLLQTGGPSLNRHSTHSEMDHRSEEGPMRHGDGPRNTVMLRNVPQEINSITRLSAHFERFGMVVNVRVNPSFRTAFVTFRSAQEAQDAVNSPDAVCGNRFITTEFARPSQRRGERIVHSRHGGSGGPLRLARGEEDEETLAHQVQQQREERLRHDQEVERIKVLTQRRVETAERLRQLEEQRQGTVSAPSATMVSSAASAPSAAVDKARRLSTLLERKRATVEAALAKCKQKFHELERNPALCTPAEKQTLMASIKELGQALRGIAEQSKTLLSSAAVSRTTTSASEMDQKSATRESAEEAAEEEGEDDDQVTSELFVRPFPAEWVDNEEDVKFHFATTTMTTPLSVEFHPQYVRVVFPGKRTAMRALESSGEWNDAPLGLHLAVPREVGPVHVKEAAADDGAPGGNTTEEAGDTAIEETDAQRMELDDDEDPDRSWKR